VTIEIQKQTYIIDLIQKCQYRRDNHFLRRKVIRFGPDISPDFQKEIEKSPSTVPANWITPYKEIKIDLTHVYRESMEILMNQRIFESGHGDKFGTIRGKDPNRYEVVRVYRIQDAIQWRSYDNKRTAIKEKIKNCNKFREEYAVRYPMCSDFLDPVANEYYLFHGTDAHTIQKIIENGFDERFGNVNGMFGPGIYFAEHSSKANQYVACPKCQGGSIPKKNTLCSCTGDIEYCMLLSRVCLGNPFICHNYEIWSSTREERKDRDVENFSPYPSMGCFLNDDCIEHHSVYAEQKPSGCVRAREFIVYDKRQTYPEFLIYYKRHRDEMI